MPDPLIASAFVRIKPEPKSVSGFGKEVRGAIEKSFARPVRIKVEPRLLPFKSRIQKELSTAVFTIKVTPVLAPGFKAQVSRLAKTAAAGITIPVTPTVPAGRAAAAKPTAAAATRGPAASTAASREAAFQERLRKLTLERATAQRALTKAEQTAGTAKQRLTAANNALSKAETIHESHLKTQDALQGKLTVKQQARLQSQINLAAKDVQSAAALKLSAQATIDKAAADLKAEATAQARTAAELERQAITKNLLAVDQAGALVTGKVAIARAQLAAATSVDNAAQALHSQTVKTGTLAEAELTEALALRTLAEKNARIEAVKGAIANEQAATAAGHRLAREKQLGKGLLATALAAAGARGATLAAGFEFLAGAAIATGLFKSIQLAAKLEEELNVFQTTASATAQEMERVSAAARELGADITLPAVSANDAATAMTELAKAGLSVQDSIDAARGTLQLGTAAQIDNAVAVNITASALNAFGLAGTQAVHVADLLAGAARESQGGIDQMGGALSSVASVARQAGLNIEDTIALLTLLTKNGIQGAESGTALRVALLRLIAPTEKARKELEKLGITVLDINGNVRPEVFADLARATNELSASERNLVLQTIFGTRAIRAQAVLGREGAAGLNEMRDSTNQVGLAAEDAAARTRGFTGQVEALKNSLATLGESLGRTLIPGASAFIDTGTEVITVLQRIKKGLEDLEDAAPSGPGGGEGGFLDRFFGGVGDAATSSGGDLLKQFQASIEVLAKGPTFAPLQEGLTRGPLGTLNAINAELAQTIDSADLLAIALNEIGSGGGVGGEQVALLQDLRSQILGSGEEAARLRERLDAVIRLTLALGRAPTAVELKVFFEKGGVDKATVDLQNQLSAKDFQIPLKPGFGRSIVDIEHSADEAMERAGVNAEKKFEAGFSEGAIQAAKDAGFTWAFGFGDSAAQELEKQGPKAARAFSSSFQDQLDLIEARDGGPSAELALAQQQLPGAQRRFNRAQADFEAKPTEQHKKFRDFALGRLNEIKATIRSATADIEGAEKAETDKLAKARNEADQNFLDALGLGRGRIENKILRAEGSAGVQDDIATHTELRNFLRRKIEEATKTIRDAQTKAETVQTLTAELIAENQKLRDLNRELITSIQEKFQVRLDIAGIIGSVGSIRKLYAALIDELQKALAEATKGSKLAQDLKLQILQTQQAAFAAINEGFELDIQIAEAQERPRAEVRARQRFIEQLKRERDQFKRGSIEYKRLTLEIINQQKAIEEANEALKDMNNASAEMQFRFLQTQTGFAANLLSNLIPGFATANLVGGSTPQSGGAATTGGFGFPGGPQPGGGVIPGMPLVPPANAGGGGSAAVGGAGGGVIGSFSDPSKTATAMGAGKTEGPTRGQQSREIQILLQILHVLQQMRRGTGHPEAKHVRATGGGSGSGSDTFPV